MKRFVFKRMGSRLTVWFLIMAILPLLTGVGITYYQRMESIKANAALKLTAVRDMKVDAINAWLDERIGDMEAIVNNPSLRDLAETSSRGNLDQDNIRRIRAMERDMLSHYLEAYPTYNEIFIIDPDTGKILVSTNPSVEGAERINYPYFTEPMKTRQLYIRDIYYSKTLKRRAMTFSAPIFCLANNGKYITGILVARVDLEHSLYELLLNRTGMGQTGETLIVNRDVIALNELRSYKDAPLKLRIKAAPAVNAAMGKTGIAETADYNNVMVLAAYTHIPRTGWGFVAKEDMAELYAPIKSMTVDFIILIFGTILAAIIVVFFLARTIATPVIGMAETAEKMRKGNLSARNLITGTDELAGLAEAFNTMAESIESHVELREINNEVTQTLVDAKDLPAFRTNILKKLVGVTDSQMGAYFALNRDTNIFEPFTAIGVTHGLLKPFDASALEGELGMVVETKKITHIKDIPKDSIFRFKTFTGTILPKEIISIPIIIDDIVSGVVSLASIKPYSRKVLDIMEQPWATGFGVALSNMWANAETAKLAAELVEKKYLIDSASSAICTSTLEGIMTYVNPSFLEIWGFEDDSQVIGKPFPEFWMVSEISDKIMGDLQNKGAWGGEIEARKKDGTLFDVQVSTATVYDETGKPVELMSSSIDISERKIAEKKILGINQELQAQAEELQSQTEELQQQSEELQEQNVELEQQRLAVEEASRLKSQFLSNMSHELRTPLNSVMALSRVLMMQAKDKLSPEEVNYLEIIERNGKNLLTLINDILDLSKIEAGRMDVTPKPFSLHMTLENIIESITPIAAEKQIEIHQDIPGDLPLLESDEIRLSQILQNLIGNAVKFTSAGSVTVSVQSDKEKIGVRITDTGIGIAENDPPYIFDEFRQIDGSASRRHEGTGLGLAIARKAARMLGGEIAVTSAPERGTIFTLTLPIVWQGTALVYEPIVGRKPADVKPARKTILVVDDEPEMAAMISRYLRQEGYNTVTATSGSEALKLATRELPFAVTLDIIMPDMDGWEVLQGLKKNPETKDIPVIIVSISEELETGFALGAFGYVTKPVSKKQLVSEIQKIGKPGTRSIMIVDDNDFDRQEVRRIIEEEGLKPIVAEDGAACLELLKKQVPDVLVLDLMMPEPDGFAVLERIRGNPDTRDLPVIVVTAKDLTEEDRNKLSGNVFSVLEKTDAKSTTLLSEIKRILVDLENLPKYPGVKQPTVLPRILIVDDNEAVIIQVKAVLESAGYVADVARGGQEAFDYVSHTIPDGIILDLMMPEIDGFAVLEKIRGTKATVKIPILILTAKDLTPEDFKKLSANNVQQLVQKGDIDRDNMLFRVRSMVEGKEYVEAGNLPLFKPNRRKLDAGERPPVTRTTKKASRNPQPATILIVEDNPDNMTTIKAVLQNRYRILEATDGEEGLRMAGEVRPDLILLDMALPKMDGFAVVRNLKGNIELSNISVIAMTAQVMKGDREKILAAGCDDYIAKPIDPEGFLKKISEWLGD